MPMLTKLRNKNLSTLNFSGVGQIEVDDPLQQFLLNIGQTGLNVVSSGFKTAGELALTEAETKKLQAEAQLTGTTLTGQARIQEALSQQNITKMLSVAVPIAVIGTIGIVVFNVRKRKK